MSLIDDEEIFARVHRFKLFRKEGNIFIDLYEALLGAPAHKYIAVPNLLLQEADKEYFGVGDSKAAAIRDCLNRIKGISIDTIVPSEAPEEPPLDSWTSPESDERPDLQQSSWNPFRALSRGRKKPQE